MSSTILYKFRSGTTFEALSLPGNNARLLDIKKAIVTAKKLDQGSMDFDLSVKDATSGVEYVDDAAILPRGSRIVVQRLPSARGQGILAKIARSQFGERATMEKTSGNEVNTDFYTIENRDHDDDEEFVSTTASQPSPLPAEDSELAALRAATELTHSTGKGMGRGAGGTALRGGPMPGSGGGGFRPNHVAGMGAPPSRGPDNLQNVKHGNRPNADPELREQEQQPQKKRATGIPRTFLSLSAAQGPDGAEGSSVVIQPNSFVFEELITRGGGQSENATGSKRDLDYAIKITATKIPEYLLCAICNNVVRDAMMLPWDPEGRTTCEQCIRNALTENGFRCPLTQQEGVSPDDLLPNYPLRKAAAQFVNDVMEKLKEIDVQADMEEEINVESDKQNLLEGDLNDKGVVLTRRVTIAEKRKKDDNDFGGGDDDFGGDVFAVEPEKLEEVIIDDPMNPEASMDETKPQSNLNESDGITNDPTRRVDPPVDAATVITTETDPDDVKKETNPDDVKPIADTPLVESIPTDQLKNLDDSKATTAGDSSAIRTTNDSIVFQNRRQAPKRRGPPVGYTMGPAVAAVQDPINTSPNQSAYVERAPYRGRRGGPHYSGNGRGFRGRYDPNRAGGRDAGLQPSYGRNHDNEEQDTSESRVAKRTRSPSESADDDNSMGARLEEDDSSNTWSTFHDTGGRGEASRGNYHYFDGRGRWGGRGGRDDGYGNRFGRWEGQREGRFPRGGYRGGFRGGRRDGYQIGGYNGGAREGFGGGRGYRGGGRGRY